MPQSQARFCRRVLLVDGDQSFLDACSGELQKVGYEVLQARDGFEALCVLRGAIPDLVITELSLPRMSGFELLAIVRTRFPQVSVIAISAEYTPVTVPNETITDAFVAKGPKALSQLLAAGHKLIAQSPIRASKARSPAGVAWLTTSPTGYVIVTCPECLRSFSIAQPKVASEAYRDQCIFCGCDVSFYMMSREAATAAVRSPRMGEQMMRRSREAIASSRRAIRTTEAVLLKRKRKTRQPGKSDGNNPA